MQQWSTSMSGSATPFFLSLLSRWVVLSFFLHWKPAQYQRFHWLSEQVTATPSPPHWSAVKARTCVIGRGRCSPLVFRLSKRSRGQWRCCLQRSHWSARTDLTLGRLCLSLRCQTPIERWLQLEDSVPPNNIRIYVNMKQKLRTMVRSFYEDMIYPHKAFALGKSLCTWKMAEKWSEATVKIKNV